MHSWVIQVCVQYNRRREIWQIAKYTLSKINTDLAKCTSSVSTIYCEKMAVNDKSLYQCAVTEFLVKVNNLARHTQADSPRKWKCLYGYQERQKESKIWTSLISHTAVSYKPLILKVTSRYLICSSKEDWTEMVRGSAQLSIVCQAVQEMILTLEYWELFFTCLLLDKYWKTCRIYHYSYFNDMLTRQMTSCCVICNEKLVQQLQFINKAQEHRIASSLTMKARTVPMDSRVMKTVFWEAKQTCVGCTGWHPLQRKSSTQHYVQIDMHLSNEKKVVIPYTTSNCASDNRHNRKEWQESALPSPYSLDFGHSTYYFSGPLTDHMRR